MAAFLGDIGSLDRDGNVHIIERVEDIINNDYVDGEEVGDILL